MIPWDLGSSSGSCNANEFPEIHRVSKIIRERMHSPLEGVWAGDVRSLYVHCVPTAYVQAMRPGTCPLHRNSCDGKPQGGSKELRHTAAVGFAKWAGIKCFICYDAAVRGAWPCVARPRDLLPTALLLVACSPGLHFVPCGPCSGGLLRGARVHGACFLFPTTASRLLAGCGPVLRGSCFQCLASIRGSVRSGCADRDPAPRP